ncbi:MULTISPECIES: LacI family DNA-binding transcriptional regulator [Rathayibacter]|uniref:LacI family DNA-binding transcriptional regulator n=1 Tax=Rathayibacter TaxID=33886 RepID=UPI001359F151|nr:MULTISPECIES: LacI family DNA-binding transcriptional regulator [Rathayibacter]
MDGIVRDDATGKRVGIRDVATLAGVSRQTVTRAMNDMYGISDETKTRVLEAARALKYRPSRFARGLVKQESLTLGLVVIDLMNPYYAEYASRTIHIAAQYGWTVLVQEIGRDEQKEHRALRLLAEQVDAIVGYLLAGDEVLDELIGDIPVVRLLDRQVGVRHPWILTDHTAGIAAALDHLVATGRRRIVMIDCPTDSGTTSPRARTFERLAGERGLESRVLPLPSANEPTVEAGRTAVEGLLTEVHDVDAIFGFNDVVALGALTALRERGVDVPRECAVIGIDGLPFAAWSHPPLTTIAVDIEQIARSGFEAIRAVVAGGSTGTHLRPDAVISHELVLRESSARSTF